MTRPEHLDTNDVTTTSSISSLDLDRVVGGASRVAPARRMDEQIITPRLEAPSPVHSLSGLSPMNGRPATNEEMLEAMKGSPAAARSAPRTW